MTKCELEVFFDLMQQKLTSEFGIHLINIGSCRLHISHNSFKSGFAQSGWNVADFLASLYYPLKDSPARREDYQEVSGFTLLPLKFVQHRWLENVPVVERAIQIVNNIFEYIQAVQQKTSFKPR